MLRIRGLYGARRLGKNWEELGGIESAWEDCRLNNACRAIIQRVACRSGASTGCKLPKFPNPSQNFPILSRGKQALAWQQRVDWSDEPCRRWSGQARQHGRWRLGRNWEGLGGIEGAWEDCRLNNAWGAIIQRVACRSGASTGCKLPKFPNPSQNFPILSSGKPGVVTLCRGKQVFAWQLHIVRRTC